MHTAETDTFTINFLCFYVLFIILYIIIIFILNVICLLFYTYC